MPNDPENKANMGAGGVKGITSDRIEEPVDEIPIPHGGGGEKTEFTRSVSGGVGPPIIGPGGYHDAEKNITNIEKGKWWEGNRGKDTPAPTRDDHSPVEPAHEFGKFDDEGGDTEETNMEGLRR